MNDSTSAKPTRLPGATPAISSRSTMPRRRWRGSRRSTTGASRRSAPASQRRRAAARRIASTPTIPTSSCPISRSDLHVDARLSYGVLLEPGTYGTTLTRPDLFGRYYEEQIGYILKHHDVPVHVGVSNRPIPLPFVIEESVTDITEADLRALQAHFALPDLSATDDSIANGTFVGGARRAAAAGALHRRARRLFARAPAALHRHVAGAFPEFRAPHQLPALCRRVHRARPRAGRQGRLHRASSRPGTSCFPATPRASGGPEPQSPRYLPQMPAYHLKRAGRRRHHAGQHRRRAVATPRPSPTTSRCCARIAG